MPSRSKQHHATGWKPYDRQARLKQIDQRRESRSKRGYDHRWYKTTRPNAIHRAGYRCEMCHCPIAMSVKESTPTMPVAEVDHIDGDSHNNDPGNLRALCRPCHSKRSAVQTGFNRTPALRPKWLKASTCKVVLVCGPPGSGKTTYARRMAQDNDIIIDLDAIRSDVTGKPWYSWYGDEGLDDALSERNNKLGRLSRAPRSQTAYFIIGEPLLTDRRWWRAKLGRVHVVVLETPPEVCKQRIDQDRRRKGQDHWSDAIDRWWRRYSIDPDDERVIGGTSSR